MLDGIVMKQQVRIEEKLSGGGQYVGREHGRW